MKLFNLDSPLMNMLTKLANLMILNLLTLLCCIPVVTVGAAVTALYYVTIKMARGDDPYIVKSYFKSFKENFKQSTIIWLIMLVVIIIVSMDWKIVLDGGMTGMAGNVMRIMLLVVTLFFVFTGLYVFPVLSRFENNIKNTIKNAFLMSVLNLPKSVLIVILHFLPVGIVLISASLLPVSFLLGIPLVAYMCSILYVKIFKRYEPEEEAVEEGEELAPLSFIVEEEMAKKEALENLEKEAEASAQSQDAQAPEEPVQGREAEALEAAAGEQEAEAVAEQEEKE